MPDPNRPFRWDLVRPDQLGTLLEGTGKPDLWFLDDLVACAAKILARCDDGDLYFVGRSLDSAFDLLGGALASTSWHDRIRQVPLSTFGFGGWAGELRPAEITQLRTNLADAGLTPERLTSRRPVVLVDLVSTGGTYETLYRELRAWVADERRSWDVAKKKLRFLGVTSQEKTSPNTWRWQQRADWTSELAVKNISLDRGIYSYFAGQQHKLSRSFLRWIWADERARDPLHDDRTRQALAEAVAVVEAGRASGSDLVRHITREPTMREPWLRALVSELN
ncbi:hypothetical protein [Amycolatopsis sp. CA-230715]|uniref:hypothetical protein n=1 Tax=Amycolatopsis sp. CA-230715 TaxID=2745196 RepID=UPI0020B3995E|nr:hypothetical protein [Amycolatopsis sp. CA-230715]